MESEKRPQYHFSKEIGDTYHTYISIADAKAAALIAITILLIGYLPELTGKSWVEYLTFFISGICLVVSIVFSLLTVFPRQNISKKDVLFWEDVRHFKTEEEYWNALKSLSEEEVGRKYASQNFALSKILHKKYKCIRHSIMFFIIGLALQLTLYITVKLL